MIRFLTFSGGFTIVQSIVFFKDSLYPLFLLNICVCFVVFLSDECSIPYQHSSSAGD